MLKLYSVTNENGSEVLVIAIDTLEAIDKAKQIFITNKIEYEKLYCEEV